MPVIGLTRVLPQVLRETRDAAGRGVAGRARAAAAPAGEA